MRPERIFVDASRWYPKYPQFATLLIGIASTEISQMAKRARLAALGDDTLSVLLHEFICIISEYRDLTMNEVLARTWKNARKKARHYASNTSKPFLAYRQHVDNSQDRQYRDRQFQEVFTNWIDEILKEGMDAGEYQALLVCCQVGNYQPNAVVNGSTRHYREKRALEKARRLLRRHFPDEDFDYIKI